MSTLIIDENFKGLTKEFNYYVFSEDIRTEGNIEIKVNILIKGYISSKGNISSEGNISSKGTISGKFKMVCGVKTKTYIEIHSEQIIRIMDNHIKIGCTLLTKEKAYSFTKKMAIEAGDKNLVIYNILKQFKRGEK